MRVMEFKMEQQGLVNVGDEIEVREGLLPNAYYYTIIPAVAMSMNYKSWERLKTNKGKIIDIKHNDRGYYVVCEFDEPEI